MQPKIAIITGASRGIGRALARGLAEDGYHLAMVARDGDRLLDVQSSIRSLEPSIETICCPLDVRDHDAVQDAVAAISDQFGRVDILVNCAGTFKPGSIDLCIDDFDAVVSTNLRGSFSFMQAVVPIMKKQQAGYIFNISSIAGLVGYPHYGAYSASKFALQGLSESLYTELMDCGIRVSAICPNWVATEFAERAGGTLDASDMIQTVDVLNTIRWLLGLSGPTCVKEVVLDCKAHPC